MPEKTHVKTTCPRDCYDACGITVLRKDGMIDKRLGDRGHAISRGGLCGKCALACNGRAAKRFFRKLPRRLRYVLRVIVADQRAKPSASCLPTPASTTTSSSAASWPPMDTGLHGPMPSAYGKKWPELRQAHDARRPASFPRRHIHQSTTFLRTQDRVSRQKGFH